VLGANPTPCPPRIFVTHDEVLAAQNRFSIESGAPGWLGLNAGAEYGPAKRWPADRFAATATALRRKTACHCLIFGGPNDLATARALADTIAASPIPGATSQPRVVNAAGQTSLRELAALLKLCRVLLTNDTGPMHLAAAVGTPVVVPFGSTSPNLTAPGLPGDPTHSLLCSNVPCAPCFLRTCPIDLRCLNSIQVDPVIDALLARLGPHTSVDPNLPPYGPSTG
jgi:heptosyltransferase-2